MGVRSKRLFGPLAIAMGSTLVYTSPANETTLVKTLTITKAPAIVATTVTWSINGVGNAAAVLTEVLTTQQRSSVLDVWLVLQPGDTLHVTTDLGIAVSGHGAQLEGVAD